MNIEEKIEKYLGEGKSRKLDKKTKDRINKEIQKILKPTYFKKIPLKDLFSVLEKYGVVPVQEDNTYWDGMLTGGTKDTVQVYFDLAWEDSKEGRKYTEEIPNASLALSYYKMEKSGKYEVIAYVS